LKRGYAKHHDACGARSENSEHRSAHYRSRRFRVASRIAMVASTMVIVARKMVISSPPRLDDLALVALAHRVLRGSPSVDDRVRGTAW
jgi:hypothetical protein